MVLQHRQALGAGRHSFFRGSLQFEHSIRGPASLWALQGMRFALPRQHSASWDCWIELVLPNKNMSVFLLGSYWSVCGRLAQEVRMFDAVCFWMLDKACRAQEHPIRIRAGQLGWARLWTCWLLRSLRTNSTSRLLKKDSFLASVVTFYFVTWSFIPWELRTSAGAMLALHGCSNVALARRSLNVG